MLSQYVVAVLCFVAAFMQLAAHRCPDIQDAAVRKSARRITIVSMFMCGCYLLFTTGWVSPIPILLIGLLATGQIMFAASSLFKEQEV